MSCSLQSIGITQNKVILSPREFLRTLKRRCLYCFLYRSVCFDTITFTVNRRNKCSQNRRVLRPGNMKESVCSRAGSFFTTTHIQNSRGDPRTLHFVFLAPTYSHGGLPIHLDEDTSDKVVTSID